MGRRHPLLFGLIGVNLIYACTSIFTKTASQNDVFSTPYLLWILGAVIVLSVYAILWQQIITRIELSEAYMFKGLSIIFVLVLSMVLFGESISFQNVIGSILIVLGIGLYAKA